MIDLLALAAYVSKFVLSFILSRNATIVLFDWYSNILLLETMWAFGCYIIGKGKHGQHVHVFLQNECQCYLTGTAQHLQILRCFCLRCFCQCGRLCDKYFNTVNDISSSALRNSNKNSITARLLIRHGQYLDFSLEEPYFQLTVEYFVEYSGSAAHAQPNSATSQCLMR